MIRRLLCEVLPLDEERRTEGALWLAFAARSLVDQRVAEEHAVVFDGVRELCRGAIHQVDQGGWLVSRLVPEIETARLHALVDGLAAHGLMGRLNEEEVLGIVDTHLEQIICDPQA